MNILLSDYSFGEGALYDVLKPIFSKVKHVTIIPFSFDLNKIPDVVGYEAAYGQEGQYFKVLEAQFIQLGISNTAIKCVHYYKDDKETMIQKIQNADVIFLTGGLPEKMMERIEEKELLSTITQYKGIVMGASAGALIQFDDYFCTPDDDYESLMFFKGLGFIRDFQIEVHYEPGRVIPVSNRPVYCLANGDGIVYEKDTITCIGDITILKN